MKQMKKILSILLAALLLISAASVAAFAAETDDAVSGRNISIDMTSNAFYESIYEFEGVDQVTVSYDMASTIRLINAQWVLTYDPAKLSVATVKMPKMTNPVIIQKSGMIVGSFTELNMVDFTEFDTFAFVTFNVIGSGSTIVDMQLDYLGVGVLVGSDICEAYPYDHGQAVNISSQAVFNHYYCEMDAWAFDGGVSFKLMDVDGNGRVNINDATALQRFLAEMSTLTSTQMLSADVDGNGKVDVRDVTEIQRYVAS